MSDHFNGKEFFNPWSPEHRGFTDVLRWKLSGSPVEAWPKWVDDNVIPAVASQVVPGNVVNTSINHATQLVQIHGLNFLTDPVFSKRTSPFQSIGPARTRAPGLRFEQLPKIDVVVISHNHYDHFDFDSVRQLAKKFNPLFIMPLGHEKLLRSAGAQTFKELDWWQNVELNSDVRVYSVPVQHWSARTPFDRNHALWCGFVIEAFGRKIYFGGDTGYGPHFTETYKKFGAMDLSLIPIGAYEPRWFMKLHHMNPEDAVQAHLDLHSKQSIGIHFGTFKLTDEGIERPVEGPTAALQKRRIDAKLFTAPKNGQTLDLSAL